MNFFDYGVDKVDYTSSLPKPIIKEYDVSKLFVMTCLTVGQNEEPLPFM